MKRLAPLVVSAASDVYFEQPRQELVELARTLVSGGTVLDVGCGAGMLGAALLQNGVARSVVGVEADAAAAAAARLRLTAVVEGDVARVEVLATLPRDVDLLVAADVLEHLARPEEVLTALRECTRSGGVALISVPNVRHLSVLADLVLRNEWRYSDAGICDRTHLRYFTSKSAVGLCVESGFRPVAVYGTVGRRSARVTAVAAGLTSFLALQTVVVCRVD